MIQTWQQFLTVEGAQLNSTSLNNTYVAHFGNEKTELTNAASGHVLVDLSHLGLLELSGDDATTFLQGQVTNDVKLLGGQHAHFTGYCNAKGRLLGLFLAYSTEQNIYLQFDQALIESTMKRLKMYVLRSKVSIKDASDQLIRLGVAGQNTANYLKTIFDKVPDSALSMQLNTQAIIIRLPHIVPSFEIITTIEHATSIWQTLKQTHKPAGKACWDFIEIQSGIPDISSNTQETFVPQMLNLDALGGINYKKGCYTGQEIVARTHYLGKVKRRTALAYIDSELSPQAGDEIIDEHQQVIGAIVRVCPALQTGFNVLAECRLDNLDQGKIFWQSSLLKILPLPYSLD